MFVPDTALEAIGLQYSSLAHATGGLYGAWIWRRWCRLGYVRLQEETGSTSLEQQLMVPSSINHAAQMASTGHMVASIVHWIYRPLLVRDASSWTRHVVNTLFVALKWIPGTLVLIPVMTFSPRLGSEPKADQLFYHADFDNWNYLRPVLENDVPSNRRGRTDNIDLQPVPHSPPSPPQASRSTLLDVDMPERLLVPRYLCYLDESKPRGYVTLKTQEWMATRGTHTTSNYIFISYTRRQFYTQIFGDPTLPANQNEALQKAADRDTNTLIQFAVQAAKAANIEAFWIDFECVQPEHGERVDDSMEDVYRICDIVRAAYSLVIITGPPLRLDDVDHLIVPSQQGNRRDWLHEWGKRLWTVPEALLCPAEHRIAVYSVGTREPETVARRNLPSLVWDDAGALRQLVDHYESSIHLTQLELISIALECLQRRQTEKRMSGDVAYALMGLLRLRPRVNRQDSGFQAFARLSLANDSDMLLERLICLKPAGHGSSSWHDMRDAWQTRLWNIHPTCQIADVVEDDTVLLGGAHAALINWTHLHPIDYSTGTPRTYSWFWARTGATTCMAALTVWTGFALLWLFVTTTVTADDDADKQGGVLLAITLLCALFFVLPLPMVLVAPAIMTTLFAARARDTQARLFGVEGRPDLEHVERVLFGQDAGRLRWVSPRDPDRLLHHPEEEDGDDQDDQDEPPHPRARTFTLIDTLTLTAQLFSASRAPSILLAGAHDHGAGGVSVRALLCSYDTRGAVLCREAVVRMRPRVLDRLAKVDGLLRFRLERGAEVGRGVQTEGAGGR